MSSGNYPPGQEHNPKAPYNQVDKPDKEFDVTVSQTLSKNTSVTTQDYIEEDCLYGPEFDTSNVDWHEEYSNQHYTPLDLINELKMIFETYKNGGTLEPTKQKINCILKECANWVQDDLEIIRD